MLTRLLELANDFFSKREKVSVPLKEPEEPKTRIIEPKVYSKTEAYSAMETAEIFQRLTRARNPDVFEARYPRSDMLKEYGTSFWYLAGDCVLDKCRLNGGALVRLTQGSTKLLEYVDQSEVYSDAFFRKPHDVTRDPALTEFICRSLLANTPFRKEDLTEEHQEIYDTHIDWIRSECPSKEDFHAVCMSVSLQHAIQSGVICSSQQIQDFAEKTKVDLNKPKRRI